MWIIVQRNNDITRRLNMMGKHGGLSELTTAAVKVAVVWKSSKISSSFHVNF